MNHLYSLTVLHSASDGDSHPSLGLDKAFNKFNLNSSSGHLEETGRIQKKTKREPNISACI